MAQTYQETKIPTTASSSPSVGGAAWVNPNRITQDDGSSASLSFFSGADYGAVISGSDFDFRELPESAVIDGLAVQVDGTNVGCYGDISLSIPGTDTEPVATLNTTYGGINDFWGLDALTVADLTGLEVSITLADVSGGDGMATIDYLSVTIYWHIELEQEPSPGLPTTFAYKVYSNDATYLGELPNVISLFSFSQDINSAGSILKTTCATSPKPVTSTEAILDNFGDPIQTNADLDILATSTYTPLLPGSSPDEALFKNGNRIKVWMYNQWYPNGKIMFSGQINRVSFQIGGADEIQITSYSDGMDLDNYVARGYPFAYTPDQAYSTQNGTVTISRSAPPSADYYYYGQSTTTGAAVENIGEISLLLSGSANVTVTLYDEANGNTIGSVTKTVSGATLSNATSFNFPQLLEVNPLSSYFFGVGVGQGQSIQMARNSAGGYAGGSGYEAIYLGGSGGGLYSAQTFDLWFETASGEPTTTTTYSTQDPVTGMAEGIILDYNSRGGRITSRDLTAAGYNLTYTFNSATILSAIQKILELSPSNYYSYVDLGTAEIDILPTSSDADFLITIGKEISQLDLSMTIERVKNQLLFSGGDTGGGTNLFKLYQDPVSSDRYDPRLGQKSDNRVTVEATADAIGESYITEESSEIHETSIVLLNEMTDITQFTPGKTLGFRNTGTFADELVLQIVRRDFSKDFVKLTVGRLPVTQTAEVQRLNRELIQEQTIDNPDQPQ